ncbi:MAG TPA: hypothetical protein VFH11_01515 [Gemmatimonadota bacterium]|nr:hypothetical protein [Gemmatimonadota bacterium]
MKTADLLFAFVLIAAGALGACDRAGESADEPEAVATGQPESESAGPGSEASPSTDPSCPPEAEVVSAVGHPVQSKPYGGGCYYETADFEASVTIMLMSPGQADQVEQEMRDAAVPYNAEVIAIDAGDRGHAWGSPGYGQGYVVAGERAWMADVSITSGDNEDKRAAVIEILEMMIG